MRGERGVMKNDTDARQAIKMVLMEITPPLSPLILMGKLLRFGNVVRGFSLVLHGPEGSNYRN